MTKILLWLRPDGGYSYTPFGATEDEARQHAEGLLMLTSLNEKGETVRVYDGWVLTGVVDDTSMPDGGEIQTDAAAAKFRNAWEWPEGRPAVNMTSARELQRDRLRAMRAPLFTDLDLAYQRADEVGDASAKAAIVQEKQTLRDVTKYPAIDAAKTPEELAAAIPDVLKD